MPATLLRSSICACRRRGWDSIYSSQIAELTRTCLIGRPIRQPALLLRDAMATLRPWPSALNGAAGDWGRGSGAFYRSSQRINMGSVRQRSQCGTRSEGPRTSRSFRMLQPGGDAVVTTAPPLPCVLQPLRPVADEPGFQSLRLQFDTYSRPGRDAKCTILVQFEITAQAK
jgi:hypothetical protein